MKRLILALLLLCQVAYGFGGKKPVPQPTPTPTISPTPVVTDPPVDTGTRIHFGPIKANDKETARVLAAEGLIRDAIAGPCFERYFLKRKLIQTNGMTNAQVIEFVRRATASIPVVYYYANNSTVGYRQPPEDTIYINRKFHNSYGNCAEASGNGHEALHVLGFGHDFKRTARRPYSIPYSWNAMMLECCKNEAIQP